MLTRRLFLAAAPALAASAAIPVVGSERLLPRETVDATMTALAGVLRRLGEQIGQHGPRAERALDEVLDESLHQLESLLATIERNRS